MKREERLLTFQGSEVWLRRHMGYDLQSTCLRSSRRSDNIPMHALIPHSHFGADYCGCLMEVVEANEARFICNECGLSSRRRMSPVSSWRWNLARPPALTGARVNRSEEHTS